MMALRLFVLALCVTLSDGFCMETEEILGLGLLQSNAMRKLPENGSQCTFDTLVAYVHHKTGTTMNVFAERALNQFLIQAGCPKSKYEIRWQGLNDSAKITAPKCFANFVRDPFEMIVSGYLYHRSLGSDIVTEPGFNMWTLSDCDKRDYDEESHGKSFTDLLMACDFDKEKLRNRSYMWDVALNCFQGVPVYDLMNSEGFGGVLGGVLIGLHNFKQTCELMQVHPLIVEGKVPQMFQNETLTTYLNRVDIESGLLFQSMWFAATTWTPMNALHDLAEASSCAINVCLPSFDTQQTCAETWQNVFEKTIGVQGTLLSGMVETAAAACPHGSIGSKVMSRHSVDSAERKNADQPQKELPSNSEMIAKAIELDSKFLNSTSAAVAAKIACQFSVKYKPKAY